MTCVPVTSITYTKNDHKCFLSESNKERIICVFAIVLHYVPNNPYMNVNTRPPFLDVSLGLTVCNKWLLPAHPQGPNNTTHALFDLSLTTI